MKKMMIVAALAIVMALALPLAAWAEDGYDYVDLDDEEQEEAETLSGAEFMYQGVYDFNGHTETWYSSQAAYHYMTPEWTADDEGFYRTDDGYYVVATDAYEQGTVIETSRGLAQVLDCGCGDNVDFYVNWGW